MSSAVHRETSAELVGLAASSATVLAGIDIACVSRRRIAPTYLIDAGANLGALAAPGASRR
jgi:hypothetical protein